MAYQVNFTDSVNKGSITVDENSLNTETSLGLPGRNLTDYGRIILEDFLHLMENFANNVSPSNPVEGQLWYDTTAGVDQLKVYDGSQWVSAGGVKKSSSTPDGGSSTIGDLWIDTSNNQLYLYTGSGYILVGPEFAEGSATGVRFEEIINTVNTGVPCIVNYIDNVPVAIISSQEFVPKLTIAGYTTIKPGINLNESISARYYGTAEKAESLVVNNTPVAGNQFARLNVVNNFSEKIRISNNNGLGLGETETLALTITGSNALITNRSNDGYVAVRVNNNDTAIRITSGGNVGIKNENPEEALDVTGNIKASGTIVAQSTEQSTSINNGAMSVAGGLGVAKNLNVGGALTLDGDFTTKSLIPAENGVSSIGTNSLVYNNVYANTFYGAFRGDVVGNVTGASGTASKLNSLTSFSIAGDVTTTAPVTFDGQTGGLSKTFDVTLDDTFFTGKDDYTDSISGSEEVLIRKTSLQVGDLQSINQFYVSTVNDITNTVPTFALGMIMPYAGSTAPSGWRICDGSSISISDSDYEPLYLLIGFTYGGSLGSGLFNLPDLRGRFPLGFLDTTPRSLPSDEDRVYDDGASDFLGGIGGSQRRYIRDQELPEHVHDLLGDQGTQFYATTNVTGGTDTNSVGINTVGNLPGTGLTKTEGVDGLVTTTETIDGVPEEVGEKFTTVSPFLTVNFIIYTGVV